MRKADLKPWLEEIMSLAVEINSDAFGKKTHPRIWHDSERIYKILERLGITARAKAGLPDEKY